MKLNSICIIENKQHLDLTSLKGMPIQHLAVINNNLADNDMHILKTLSFNSLDIRSNPGIRNLEFIRDICPGLRYLYAGDTGISDLSPLNGRKLNILMINQTNVSDLSPIKGMPLNFFDCSATKISDLSPIAGMKLKNLFIHETEVSDISAIKGMSLNILYAHNCKNLMDLKVIAEQKELKTLTIPSRATDIEFLRLLPLEFLDTTKKETCGELGIRTAKQFWADHDAAKSGK